jgi:hypothetical protein
MIAWGLCAVCHMRQRSWAGGFIESDGGMFEHLQHMDYSSSTCTREPIPPLPRLARLQRARFLGPVKNITSFPQRFRSCTVKIGDKMLKLAYS